MATNDMVPELTNAEFNEFIKKGLVFIDFFAEWCMPCVMMGPIIDDIAEKFKGKIKFGKVNVGESQELAQKYNVSSIPNLTIFRNGKVINQFVGSMSEDELEEKLNSLLK